MTEIALNNYQFHHLYNQYHLVDVRRSTYLNCAAHLNMMKYWNANQNQKSNFPNVKSYLIVHVCNLNPALSAWDTQTLVPILDNRVDPNTPAVEPGRLAFIQLRLEKETRRLPKEVAPEQPEQKQNKSKNDSPPRGSSQGWAAVFNISSDLVMLYIPLPILMKAQLPLKRKIILCAVFSLGVLIVVLETRRRTWPQDQGPLLKMDKPLPNDPKRSKDGDNKNDEESDSGGDGENNGGDDGEGNAEDSDETIKAPKKRVGSARPIKTAKKPVRAIETVPK
ncbi:MAG: hypothetical protein Q9218_004349 [Villophora microphyllina]